jgi:predicted RNase H-like HicB family nuclease
VTKPQYKVVLEQSEEGFAVSVPGVPSCHSEGQTEGEALANIADAIRDYLAVVDELRRSKGSDSIDRTPSSELTR